jgi:hypothetical protein
MQITAVVSIEARRQVHIDVAEIGASLRLSLRSKVFPCPSIVNVHGAPLPDESWNSLIPQRSHSRDPRNCCRRMYRCSLPEGVLGKLPT